MSPATPAAEDLFTALDHLYAQAASGNLRRKHVVIKALTEGCQKMGATMARLSMLLQEPGVHLDAGVHEPVSQAGQHCQAAAMSMSEADASLSALLAMTVAELADSPRQAPHHSQLQEGAVR